jgi:hypothetical protein
MDGLADILPDLQSGLEPINYVADWVVDGDQAWEYLQSNFVTKAIGIQALIDSSPIFIVSPSW